jgi:hypothetical protein
MQLRGEAGMAGAGDEVLVVRVQVTVSAEVLVCGQQGRKITDARSLQGDVFLRV